MESAHYINPNVCVCVCVTITSTYRLIIGRAPEAIKGVLGSTLLCLLLRFPSAMRKPLTIYNSPHCESDKTLDHKTVKVVSYNNVSHWLCIICTNSTETVPHQTSLRSTVAISYGWMNDICIRFVVARSLGGFLLIFDGALSLLLVLIQQRNIISWRRLHIAQLKITTSRKRQNFTECLPQLVNVISCHTGNTRYRDLISGLHGTNNVSSHWHASQLTMTLSFLLLFSSIGFDFRCSTSSLNSGLTNRKPRLLIGHTYLKKYTLLKYIHLYYVDRE